MFSSNTSQVSNNAVFVEDVFSTWLYTGNGSTQTITNGIDLAGKGGLVWVKARNAAYGLLNWDTSMPYFSNLSTYNPDALINQGSPFGIASASATGFATGNTNWARVNESGTTYASWTFREQPKFFDVVTYTGDGVAGRTVAHNLGSVPGAIFIKRLDGANDWAVFHKDVSGWLKLNTTDQASSFVLFGPNTSTTFKINDYGPAVNQSGATYVAYIFAHNAGGFGLTGTDNVISCGSFTGAGPGTPVNVPLGYEPQWLLAKPVDSVGGWLLVDNMRGWTTTTNGNTLLYPNTSGADDPGNWVPGQPTATGFNALGSGGVTYIYIAIRRGPMKTPTSGTSVYATDTLGGTSGGTAAPAYRAPFPVDFAFEKRTNASDNWIVNDRLRGINSLNFNLTAAEALYDSQYKMDFMNGWVNYAAVNSQYRSWMFRRAPGFFDVVCYTGTGSATTVNHNLGVAPELMIVKQRSGANYWPVYSAAIGNDYILSLNTTGAKDGPGAPQWNNTAPTASVFSLGASSGANASGATYVAYLFASCPGVSKVGSYTGNGSTQTIDCGFTGGARFVLIKRTDSTGDWYAYDTARGMTTLTDPYLLLNSTAAESATLGSVTTVSTGFAVNASILAAINTNSASYIFLAIA